MKKFEDAIDELFVKFKAKYEAIQKREIKRLLLNGLSEDEAATVIKLKLEKTNTKLVSKYGR